MNSLGKYVSKRGLRDGLVHGRRVWTILGGMIWLWRLARLLVSRRPEVVAREVLSPGQSITITAIDRESSR